MRMRKWLCQSCCSPCVLCWARTLTLTHFCSKALLGARAFWLWEGCLLPPLSSPLQGVQLSTRAVCSAPAIRAFVSRMGNQCLLQQIYFCTRSLEKTKDSFTCRSLQPWKMRKSTELGIRPNSQQNYFPLCPLCFTWCSWMSLKRLLKQPFPKFLLFPSWTISIGGFLQRARM